ncbi:MAG: adenylate kinase family protein [Actinomycetota bacterium]
MSVNRAARRGPRVLVVGRPGSGKGTHGRRLAQRLGVPHISTGDLFRATVALDTPLGRVLRGYLDAGDLVPDDLVLDVVDNRLAVDGVAAGFVLDGFPRTVPQAEQLLDLLDPYALDLVLDLVVTPEVALERLTQRSVCGDCGRSAGPAVTAEIGPCGDCGGILSVRADDDAPTVSRRLAVHDEQTGPLVAWLEDRAVVARVDGLGSPDEVATRIDVACVPLMGADRSDLAS